MCEERMPEKENCCEEDQDQGSLGKMLTDGRRNVGRN
jgi:hypothetical protein